MIRNDVFKDSDICLLAEAKDYEGCPGNLFKGKSKLIRINVQCRLISTLLYHNAT